MEEKDTSRKKCIYDGIKISERGRDAVVLILSLALILCFAAAIITRGG